MRSKFITLGFFLVAFTITTGAQVYITPPLGSGGSGTIVGGSCTDQVVTAIAVDGSPTCSDIALAMADSSTGTGAFLFANSPTFVDDFDLVSTGIRFSATDGKLTLLGLGNGADEDLSLDLDVTANSGVWTSSTGLTLLEFPSITLKIGTTGSCSSPANLICASSAFSPSANDVSVALISGNFSPSVAALSINGLDVTASDSNATNKAFIRGLTVNATQSGVDTADGVIGISVSNDVGANTTNSYTIYGYTTSTATNVYGFYSDGDGNQIDVLTGAGLQLKTNGVQLSSDGDGALTIAGLGNGSDENLVINLDDTANTAVITSSTGVTSISQGVIGTSIVNGSYAFPGGNGNTTNIYSAVTAVAAADWLLVLDNQSAPAGSYTIFNVDDSGVFSITVDFDGDAASIDYNPSTNTWGFTNDVRVFGTYRAADNSVGVTVTNCTAFEQGICTAGTEPQEYAKWLDNLLGITELKNRIAELERQLAIR